MTVTRRTLFTAAAAAATLPAMAALAPATRAQDAQPHGFQGIQRRRVGGITIHALSDGFLPLDASVFPAVDEARFAEVADAHFVQVPTPTAVNAFLIESGDARILVDTGTANAFGPTLGKLPTALAAAGVDPAGITHVFLTHLHPDHAGGLAPGGEAAFANAELVVAEAEAAFWLSEDNKAAAPEGMHSFFDAAVAAVAPYAERTRRLAAGADLTSGISTMALPGHTPGHTGLMIDDGGEQLLIWADIIHNQALQFADPSVTIAFDVDQAMAEQTRLRLFDQVVTDRLMVAGSHLDFPGFGHVDRMSGGGFHFVPARFPYTD